jgi:hypothetical protein
MEKNMNRNDPSMLRTLSARANPKIGIVTAAVSHSSLSKSSSESHKVSYGDKYCLLVKLR